MDAANPLSYSGSGTTWFDLSTQNRNGTINGATFSTDSGGCFVFNGTTSFIVTATLPGTGNGNFSQSICVWVSPNDTDGNIVAVSNSNPSSGWNMPPIVAQTSRFRGKYWGSNYLYSTTYTNNQWYYLSLIFNIGTSTQSFYMNGTLIESQSGANYSASGTDNFFFLGQANNGADNVGMFAARIAVLQVYSNKALTGSEILDNFNTDRGRFGV